MKLKILIPLLSLFMVSCNAPRTLYLKNNMDDTITLHIHKDSALTVKSFEPMFIDSLDGRSLQKGYVIINFGPGRWSKNDQESLKNILQKTSVTKSGMAKHFRLPDDISVNHIGAFVNELVVKIKALK